MKANFDRCMAQVFASEGGFVDDPQDPGGATNLGITIGTLSQWRGRKCTKAEVKALTREEAAKIYRRDYWDAVRGDDLPFGLDLCAFDGAVNSGASRGAKWLQQALGVNPDGKIGPATLAAAKSTYQPAAIMRAVGFRRNFLMQLPGWAHFGAGWDKRLKSVEAEATAMADPHHEPPVRPDVQPVEPQTAAGWWIRAIWQIFDSLTHKWRT